MPRKGGWRRLGSSGRFRYVDARGNAIGDDDKLARIRALVIPPAWESVWICESDRGHLQATGRDSRGRKQYRYHPAFREARDGNKFDRVAAFGAALPRLRAQLADVEAVANGRKGARLQDHGPKQSRGRKATSRGHRHPDTHGAKTQGEES